MSYDLEQDKKTKMYACFGESHVMIKLDQDVPPELSLSFHLNDK